MKSFKQKLVNYKKLRQTYVNNPFSPDTLIALSKYNENFDVFLVIRRIIVMKLVSIKDET